MATRASNRARKRRKRRLKKSVKVAITIFILIILAGGYSAFKIYQATTRPDPHGSVGHAETTEVVEDDVLEDTSLETADYWILDAGDGEAIFLRIGETEVLVDTGPAEKADSIIKTVKSNIKGDLDYVVLTNADKGRIGGVEKLYKEVTVKNTILGPMGDQKDTIRKFIGKNGTIMNGKSTTFDLEHDAMLTISKPDVVSSDVRDQSLMAIFEYGDTRFISESDAGVEEEARLLGSFTECDVLVLARHGSSETNKIDLGERYAIASTGKDSKFPDKSIIEKHDSVFSTAKSGTIKFTTNSIIVETTMDTSKSLR